MTHPHPVELPYAPDYRPALFGRGSAGDWNGNAMRMWRTIAVWLVLVVATGVAQAKEPFAEFVAGMRERGFFDYALIYLDDAHSDPKTPAELKTLIPFEKATVLIEWARSGQGGPDLAAKNYDLALALLDKFIQDNPTHERGGQANSDRGRILLGRARIESWNARIPGNEASKFETQRKAFDFIMKAREIFQQARNQHEKSWLSYGAFIDQKDNPEKFEQRRRAEVRFIQAQLDLCECAYEEAQTQEKNSADYKKKLDDAAEQFKLVHDRYRSQLGGLHARAKQAKCFEEQDDVIRALGIYDELLAHPDESLNMVKLKDLVRQFRLICLNHPNRKDYQVVADEAAAWFKSATPARRATLVGLGIMWEQARAQEKLSERDDIPKIERNKYLRESLKSVQQIKRNPGQYRELATSKERELLRRLQGDGGSDTPQDFSSASSVAEELITKKTKDFLDAINAAKRAGRTEDLQKANDGLKAHVAESMKMVKLALRLADATVATADLNRMRYYLAYTHFLSRNSYETAVISEFLATHSGKDNVVQAQEAAYMAVNAYVQAFNENEKAGRKADQEIDLARMSRMAKLLTDKWPSSDRAMDARLQMSSACSTLKHYDEAVSWLSPVPELSSRYIDAQQRSGQVLWTAYIEAAMAPAVEQPPKEKLDEWMKQAEQHFRNSITKAEKETAADAPAPDTLIASKVALVQILVQKGEFAEGVKLLTAAPHQVMGSVAPKPGEQRAKSGITSVEFASLAHQLLLRCYVGTQQLNEARGTMLQLELVGGDDGSHMTEVYKDLGQELQKELERLKSLGQNQKLDQVRRSFESFLGELSLRKDQTAGSLIWIGETYFGLGETSSDDKARSDRYFKDASEAYQQIIDRVKNDATFVDEEKVLAVRLRLAGCRRKQKQFEQAMAMIKPILAANAATLDAQFEANALFQEWAADGAKDASKRYLQALHGDKKLGSWGWGLTAKNLHRLISSNADAKPRYEQKLYQCVFNQAACRFDYGMSLAGAKRKEQLGYAKTELLSYVSITQDFDPVWWRKFDSKYREILGKLGEPVKPLEKPKQTVVVVETEKPKTEPVVEKVVAKAEQEPEPKEAEKPKGSGFELLVFGVILLAGIGGLAYSMMAKGSKKRPKLGAASASDSASKPRRTK